MKKRTTTFPGINKGLDQDGYPQMNARGNEAVQQELYDGVKDIPGVLKKTLEFPTPSDFHVKFMKNGLTHTGRKNSYTYPDIKIRDDLEMLKGKKHFNPKDWNMEKILFYYDRLFRFCIDLQRKNAELKLKVFLKDK